MKSKNLVGLLLVAGMLLEGTCVYAQKVLINNVYYTLDGTSMTAEIAVQSSSTAVGDIVIGDSVSYEGASYAVTGMADEAFEDCNQLTSIVLPQTLRYLGKNAFLRCTNLTSCIIPDSTITEIPFEAFWKAGLIEFRVPEGVTYIEQRSFEQMPNLQRVHLANSVKSLTSWSFYNLPALQDPIYNDSLFVLMPRSYSGAYTIPAGIQVIYKSAFYGCTNITSLTIPEGVKRVEHYGLMFSLNAVIKTLHLPASLEYVTPGAIFGGSLRKISVAEGNTHYTTWNDMLMTINMDTLVYCPAAINASFTLPESVVHVAASAFSVTAVDLTMTNVRSIGEYAFEANSLGKYDSNRHYVIPETVEEIGDEAFYRSYSMDQVTIPSSLKQMGEQVFADSPRLKKAVIKSTMIGKGQFRICNNLETIEIGDSLKEIRPYAFHKCPALWYIRMPKANDYFRTIDGVLFSADTTALALYPPKHDGNIIVLPEQTTTLRSGSLRGIDKDKLVLSRQTALLENEVFGGYFWGNDDTPLLDTIVAPMMSVPATQGNPFNLLNQAQTVLLVPCDSLAEIYRANSIWKGFNIQVDNTLLEQDQQDQEVTTEPEEHSVQFTWPAVEGASYYTLIIWANEERTEKICTLTFNTMGQLVEIDFSKHAPARLPQEKESDSFSFRYNGLDENTDYWFTLTAFSSDEIELYSTSGSFKTLGNQTPTGMENIQSDHVPCTKIIRNGKLYLIYEGRMYDVRGNQIK
ncbi:MAG: leucine-rich repeat domain-containing protein [Paludibacteraceae bacterium]|nr:leucine-rich repeat domain-containing protein [Paludibacteraceae bacterium]